MTSAADVAADFTAMLKAGQHEEAGAKYWADDVVSVEAMDGPMGRVEGRRGVEQKGEWWYANHEIHSVETEGPYINGDQFAVKFSMDVTQKESGQRIQMQEFGLYTVKNGKVVEERFFYGAGA